MRGKRKPVYFVFCEGASNKTETTYLSHFKKTCSEYSLIVKSTNHSDPKTMLDFAVSYSVSHGFKKSNDDQIFLLCDVDTCQKRRCLMNMEILKRAEKKNAMILFSNPSFEIWFLNHFKYHSKNYRDQDELIRELKKYLPDYEKNKDIYFFLPDIGKAIENSKRQSME